MRKQIVHFLSSLFPGFFTRLAYRQMTNPQVRKLREHELAILKTAEEADVPFKDFSIKTYTWHGGDDAVLLVHGWEGQAGNFADLIDKLVAHNYTVYAFDGPSHGFSSKGSTSLFEFTELVGIMIRKFGVEKLVSHSFGGVATTVSLFQNQDLAIDKYALITTPDSFIERINYMADQTGISDKVKNRLIRQLEHEIGRDINTVNVRDFVKEINVKEALIIHDKDDKVIPIDQPRRVDQNWEQSKLKEVEGTGHFRILRTDSVLNQVVAFINS